MTDHFKAIGTWCQCVCGQQFYAEGAAIPAMQKQVNAHIADCPVVKRGDWLTRWHAPSEPRLGTVDHVSGD